MYLYKISILIIKNKTIFDNRTLASIAFSIITYFLNLYLIIYLIYSVSILILTKENKRSKKRRENNKLERYNKRRYLKDCNFNNIFKRKNRL